MNNILLKIEGIKKTFGQTIAVDDVSLEITRGEVLGLVGENGSGKSTLSAVLSGVHHPNGGLMYFKDELYQPSTMLDSLSKGIGIIVQESGTIPGISIAENLFIGNENKFGKILISKKKMIKAANEVLKNVGMSHIDSSLPIYKISIQDRKLVETAKVMMHNPDILIVDETTTALSQHGREIIYKLVKEQVKKDKSVIFISHDLDEIMNVSDRIIVLRDGKKIVSLDKTDFNEDVIKKNMIGREMLGNYYPDFNRNDVANEVILSASNVYSMSGLLDINLSLHKGEILGIGGLSHCGMHELGKILFGADKLLFGSVKVDDNKEIKNVKQAIDYGVGYVPKDRDLEALVNSASIKDNIAVCGLDFMKRKPFNLISVKAETEYVKRQIDSLSIKCSSEDQMVFSLSGGNKQKVVFGKWMGRDSKILILDCPTRGVDIGVKAAMYKLMDTMRKDGKGIIMISEELPELIGMSNRIIIMKNKKIVREVTNHEEMTEENLINYMV